MRLRIIVCFIGSIFAYQPQTVCATELPWQQWADSCATKNPTSVMETLKNKVPKVLGSKGDIPQEIKNIISGNKYLLSLGMLLYLSPNLLNHMNSSQIASFKTSSVGSFLAEILEGRFDSQESMKSLWENPDVACWHKLEYLINVYAALIYMGIRKQGGGKPTDENDAKFLHVVNSARMVTVALRQMNLNEQQKVHFCLDMFASWPKHILASETFRFFARLVIPYVFPPETMALLTLIRACYSMEEALGCAQVAMDEVKRMLTNIDKKIKGLATIIIDNLSVMTNGVRPPAAAVSTAKKSDVKIHSFNGPINPNPDCAENGSEEINAASEENEEEHAANKNKTQPNANREKKEDLSEDDSEEQGEDSGYFANNPESFELILSLYLAKSQHGLFDAPFKEIAILPLNLCVLKNDVKNLADDVRKVKNLAQIISEEETEQEKQGKIVLFQLCKELYKQLNLGCFLHQSRLFFFSSLVSTMKEKIGKAAKNMSPKAFSDLSTICKMLKLKA